MQVPRRFGIAFELLEYLLCMCQSIERVVSQQEGVKGSQGAGKVDEALDRSNIVTEEIEPERKGPPAGAKGKKKGRR